MNVNTCFKIGYVAKTHGLKGEITLTLFPECPALKKSLSLFLEINTHLVPHTIETVSTKGTRAYLKLEGINTVASAEALKGCSLYLPKSQRPNLSKGEFYSDEVIGFEVVDAEKGPLGAVNAVFEAGSNRHLVILREGREVLIPLNGPFVKGVNRARKQIRVELPDGLLEL